MLAAAFDYGYLIVDQYASLHSGSGARAPTAERSPGAHSEAANMSSPIPNRTTPADRPAPRRQKAHRPLRTSHRRRAPRARKMRSWSEGPVKMLDRAGWHALASG